AAGAEGPAGDRDQVTGPGACSPTPPRLRILLADDNEVNQRISMALLERQGHQVHVVGNGHDALAALASEPPFDVVLMDVQMPGMDGLQATAQGDRERCLAAGMDGYVTKPISGATLARAIAAVLRRPSAAPPVEDHSPLPGPAATVDEAVVIDTPALLRRLGGNRALLAQVVQLFRTDCTKRM